MPYGGAEPHVVRLSGPLIPEDPGFTAREADLQVKAVPVREHARFLCLGDAHRRQPI